MQTVASSNQDRDPTDERSLKAFVASQDNMFKILKSQGDQILMLSKLVQDLSTSSASQNREQLIDLPSPKKPVKCFGCGEVGHVLPKCPHKRNNGNKMGIRKVSNSGSNAGPDSGVVSTISGALIIHARISARVYPCLIDSGSEATIINESLVPSDEIRDSSRTLIAANGSSIEVSGVVDLPLFVDRHQFQSSFIVSPQIRNVILGLDWLEAHDCLIDCKNTTLIAGNRQFRLGHVHIARKGPVNCRILKASVKIPGPVNHKIWNTSKIPDSQSQVVQGDKLNPINAEHRLEELNVPVDPFVVDGCQPRRVKKKSFRIANDFVFNLLPDNRNENALLCHLCGHPPFSRSGVPSE